MRQEEKHHVGNTLQELKLAHKQLSQLEQKYPNTTKQIDGVKDHIEHCAKRLEKCRNGKAVDKHVAAFGKYSDLELLTMLLIGEAEGEPWESKVGVGLTVANRVKARKKYFGIGWKGVMLASTRSGAPQFSCFASKPRIKSMILNYRKRSPLWQEHWTIAVATYFNMISDFVGHPLYYHATSFKPHGWWLKLKKLGGFGNHVFYNAKL